MKSYLRFLSRNKLYTAIEVVGLSLALAFVIILGSYIMNEISINKGLKNTDEIYLCHLDSYPETQEFIPEIYDKIPDIENKCNIVFGNNQIKSLYTFPTMASYKDNQVNVKIIGVSDTFFDFFSFHLAEGDCKTVLNSENNVVISEEMARILFPGENPVGKVINIFEKNQMRQESNDAFEDFDVNLIVSGIFEPFSKSIFRQPDMLMNYDLLKKVEKSLYGNYYQKGIVSFVRLSDKANYSHVCEDMNKEYQTLYGKKKYLSKWKIKLTQFNEIVNQDHEYFSKIFDNIRNGKLFGIYLIMCILITIVSLLDYIVLTIAYSRFRIKEIATRQLLGTDKKGVIKKCFTEALILLVISCIFAVCIACGFKEQVGKILGVEINPLAQLNEFLVLGSIIIVMTSLAGAVPSIILSSYNPINIIKGEARYRTKVIFSQIVIGFAGLLCIGALSICFGVLRQTNHLINQPLGYQFDKIVCTELYDGDNAFWEELESLPFVDKVGSYQSLPTQWTSMGIHNNATGDDDMIRFIEGDSKFISILGLQVVEDLNSSASNSLENQWYVTEDGYESISQYMTNGLINLYYPQPLRGIISNFKIGNIEKGYCQTPLVRLCDDPEDIEFGFPIIKVNINEQKAKKLIEEFYINKGYDSKKMLFFTLREEIESELKEEKNMMKLLTGFSIICILMSIMTIVGMSSYHTKITERDNAVRNVFGCSKKEMIRRIVMDFTLPVVVSAVLAIPIA